jgi:hypothetical protein
MTTLLKKTIVLAAVAGLLFCSGCSTCIPKYTAPPEGPVSACYPAGHDPFIPMDHNPSPLNPFDLLNNFAAPMAYGPPR